MGGGYGEDTYSFWCTGHVICRLNLVKLKHTDPCLWSRKLSGQSLAGLQTQHLRELLVAGPERLALGGVGVLRELRGQVQDLVPEQLEEEVPGMGAAGAVGGTCQKMIISGSKNPQQFLRHVITEIFYNI